MEHNKALVVSTVPTDGTELLKKLTGNKDPCSEVWELRTKYYVANFTFSVLSTDIRTYLEEKDFSALILVYEVSNKHGFKALKQTYETYLSPLKVNLKACIGKIGTKNIDKKLSRAVNEWCQKNDIYHLEFSFEKKATLGEAGRPLLGGGSDEEEQETDFFENPLQMNEFVDDINSLLEVFQTTAWEKMKFIDRFATTEKSEEEEEEEEEIEKKDKKKEIIKEKEKENEKENEKEKKDNENENEKIKSENNKEKENEIEVKKEKEKEKKEEKQSFEEKLKQTEFEGETEFEKIDLNEQNFKFEENWGDQFDFNKPKVSDKESKIGKGDIENSVDEFEQMMSQLLRVKEMAPNMQFEQRKQFATQIALSLSSFMGDFGEGSDSDLEDQKEKEEKTNSDEEEEEDEDIQEYQVLSEENDESSLSDGQDGPINLDEKQETEEPETKN
ncbi:alpha- and gamma-adaptin-binding protein p34 [Anaeramoeba flamelloides]|uniref:Alpha- and gamma-adaptin-binding protein p34 n=1 Tax=Anaeramoeba flamelloides TaxID=1746091 RepID=A0ABQ8YA78_9EUKA|nr:alpha- and gamma-adaptin-binding protein p34 [Anaeramoeba flamelloides]